VSFRPVPSTGAAPPFSHDTQLTDVSADDHHTQSHSVIGADHSGFPGGGTTFLRDDATFALPPGGGGAPVWSTVNIDLGVSPRFSGNFTIVGVGLTVGKPVIVAPAVGPYPGSGSLADEVELNDILAAGVVESATVIRVYWRANHRVSDTVRFDYIVSG